MANKVRLRPLQALDERAVEVLLHDLWQHDPKMLMVYRVHRPPSASDSPIRLSLVAEVDGEVRGVGSLMEHTLHPRLLWAAINVAPDQQRRRLGSAMYEALQGLGDGRPWMVKLTLRDEAGTGFLRKRGFFSPRRRRIMGILDPSNAAVRRWLEGVPGDVPGYRFCPSMIPTIPPHLRTSLSCRRRFVGSTRLEPAPRAIRRRGLCQALRPERPAGVAPVRARGR